LNESSDESKESSITDSFDYDDPFVSGMPRNRKENSTTKLMSDSTSLASPISELPLVPTELPFAATRTPLATAQEDAGDVAAMITAASVASTDFSSEGASGFSGVADVFPERQTFTPLSDLFGDEEELDWAELSTRAGMQNPRWQSRGIFHASVLAWEREGRLLRQPGGRWRLLEAAYPQRIL
jgi:hypothetical protein